MSRKLYFWQVSRWYRPSDRVQHLVFSDRRDAERQFRAWREDPSSVGNVDMDKVWTAWAKDDIAGAINANWHSIENIKSLPVFKYANEEWEEMERMREFRKAQAEARARAQLGMGGDDE